MGIAIKEAQLVEQVTGKEKIPVSDGSGLPKAVTTEQIKEYIGNGGDDNVQSDWNETDPTSDAFIKNKPTVPSEVTEQTVTDWGFTKNTGDYSKPSTGIPKSDLASDVQSSLGKADTALQEHQDISGLATKGELNNKQDTLVSGTNIKTINGKNILGEGNIVIEGGGSVDLTGYATEDWVKDEIKGKQDKIADLDNIRSGASKGATALQSVPSNYVTTTMLNEAIEEAITNTLAEKV